METENCDVVYLDERARYERTVEGEQPIAFKSPFGPAPTADGDVDEDPPFGGDIDASVQSILSSFHRGELHSGISIACQSVQSIGLTDHVSIVHVCTTSASCLSKIIACNESGTNSSVLVLIDIPNEDLIDRRPLSAKGARSPSPSSDRRSAKDTKKEGEPYGLSFLRHVRSEALMNNIPNVVMPVAVLRQSLKKGFRIADNSLFGQSDPFNPTAGEQRDQTQRLLDAGAIDVVTTPVSSDRAHAMLTHAYRIQRDYFTNTYQFARARRKSSWMGPGEVKPFSYLREAMVSRLMDGICNPHQADQAVDLS